MPDDRQWALLCGDVCLARAAFLAVTRRVQSNGVVSVSPSYGAIGQSCPPLQKHLSGPPHFRAVCRLLLDAAHLRLPMTR